MRTLIVLLALLAAPVAFAGGGDVHRLAPAKPIELLHATPSSRGTILMFHGYSCTPKQWEHEAQARFAEGYDVMVAALPGHAFVDRNGVESHERLPAATQADHYEKFAQAMFDLANARSSGHVHVVGFSVGGAHALEVALRHKDDRAADGKPVVGAAVALNPYLGHSLMGPGPIKVDFAELVSRADTMTGGRLAKHVLAKMSTPFGSKTATPEDPNGLTSASLGNVLAIGRFGDHVAERAKDGPVGAMPLYAIVSEHDPLANPAKTIELAQSVGGHVVRVPSHIHNLLSPTINTDEASRKVVHDVISRALADGEAR
jgi:pimeloyl-ACP methyl ester carboxylesterase